VRAILAVAWLTSFLIVMLLASRPSRPGDQVLAEAVAPWRRRRVICDRSLPNGPEMASDGKSIHAERVPA
jgi:hypothetical protein